MLLNFRWRMLLLPLLGVGGRPPIVADFEFNVDGTLSTWDIGNGTILEAWR